MKPIYLVATGEVFGGQETYTRHESRPALCDAECLYSDTGNFCEELRQEGYAEGRYDEVEQIAKDLLPGSYYMDAPNGGSVSLHEQLRRMAEDAAKWRNQAGEPPEETCPSCKGSGTQILYGPDPDWSSEEGQCEKCGGTGAIVLVSAPR